MASFLNIEIGLPATLNPGKEAKIRIAFLHSFYSSRQPSGENFVVESEVNALRRGGYKVELFAARTDELEGDMLYPLKAALRVATGRGRSPIEAISAFKPRHRPCP